MAKSLQKVSVSTTSWNDKVGSSLNTSLSSVINNINNRIDQLQSLINNIDSVNVPNNRYVSVKREISKLKVDM